MIPRFITSVLSGTTPTVYGDGRQTRDFTYVENVVEANILACAAPKAASGRVYNIACGDRISLLEVLEIIYGLAGHRVPPRFELQRAGDVRDSLADISLACDVLGFRPKVDFAHGLSKTYDFFKS